jgi:sugar lactone lactonase YvrE
VIDVLNGSEDFAFDGKGRIAARQGNKIVLVDSANQTTDLVANFSQNQSYGLRYRPDGNLVVAMPGAGTVVQVTPNGIVTDYVTGLGTPNGLYPDFDGNVWMTEIGAGRVSRINPDKTVDTLVTGTAATSANGIVLDATRSLLFYTNYSAGRIRSLDISQVNATPLDVITIQGGARLDGLVMDACGNLYVVDQGNDRLYRIWLDSAGAAMGAPELLANLPTSVANAQFGSGTGFDPLTLYVGGTDGDIYAVAVGVPGAPVPTPP